MTGFYNKWNTNEAEMKELVYINPVTTSIQVSTIDQTLRRFTLEEKG